MLTKDFRFLYLVIGFLSILVIPMIAMQYTDQVNWTFADFMVAGLILIALSVLIEFGLRKLKGIKLKTIYLLIVVVAFALLWAELAVGIFNSPIAGS